MIPADLPRPQDKTEILKRLGLFTSCTDAQLQLVAERTRLLEYKKGEYVYREQDRADAFYIVVSGRLRVYAKVDGSEQLYTILHNGDTCGKISLLTGETHSATVEALNDTLVVRLAKEDFDELIVRIPSLVLYLSRLLSKRLRSREQAAVLGEATVASIYGAAKGVGRTSFTIALAAALYRETARRVIVVDVSSSAEDARRVLGTLSQQAIFCVPVRSLWSDEVLQQEVAAHAAGFHVLSAGDLMRSEGGAQFVAPLVSALTRRYDYILIDLPVEVDATVLKALTQSDLIYFVTDSKREHVIRTSALIRQVETSVGATEQRMKVILNAPEEPEEERNVLQMLQGLWGRIRTDEIPQQLGRPVNFTVPYVPSSPGQLGPDDFIRLLADGEAPYAIAMRRIARELGGLLVGLALGSGAAMGLAHIGVLKVLERERIPIDLVAGSSIGALIAALWASGRSAEDIERLTYRFKNPWAVRMLFFLDFGIPLFSVLIGLLAGIMVAMPAGLWTGILFGLIVGLGVGVVFGPLSGGPIQGTRVTEFLNRIFGDMTFEDTKVPLKIVAANPMAREEIVFESGRLADAVRASISIPGIFKPVTYQGKVCLDGGVANPIPVSVLKQAGANRVIAVNVFPTTEDLKSHEETVKRNRETWDAQLASRALPVRVVARLQQEFIRSISPLIFDVIMRSMQAMEHQIAEVDCRDADVTLRPTLPGAHWLEFYNPEKFIQRGEEETIRQLEALKRAVGMPAPSLTTPQETGTIQR